MRDELSYAKRQPTEHANADSSSYELDEHEPTIKNLTTATSNTNTSSSTSTSYTSAIIITSNTSITATTATATHIKDDSDGGELTDTQSTHSSSSTPTTADVADVVADADADGDGDDTISSFSPAAQLMKRHATSLNRQQKQQPGRTDDSSAPRDEDNVPTVSLGNCHW